MEVHLFWHFEEVDIWIEIVLEQGIHTSHFIVGEANPCSLTGILELLSCDLPRAIWIDFEELSEDFLPFIADFRLDGIFLPHHDVVVFGGIHKSSLTVGRGRWRGSIEASLEIWITSDIILFLEISKWVISLHGSTHSQLAADP